MNGSPLEVLHLFRSYRLEGSRATVIVLVQTQPNLRAHACVIHITQGLRELVDQSNRLLSNCASVPANNNRKSRLRAKFSYICCIFSHEASTSGHCSRELKRNSKVVYCSSSADTEILQTQTRLSGKRAWF